jgi:hypothetical protein
MTGQAAQAGRPTPVANGMTPVANGMYIIQGKKGRPVSGRLSC